MNLDCSENLARVQQEIIELEMALLASANPNRRQRLAVFIESRRHELAAVEADA